MSYRNVSHFLGYEFENKNEKPINLYGCANCNEAMHVRNGTLIKYVLLKWGYFEWR